VVLLNSNPATIMTDPGFADRTYVGPMTPELVEQILIKVCISTRVLHKYCAQVLVCCTKFCL
jgi:carbamoylphosphate synthase large subunit